MDLKKGNVLKHFAKNVPIDLDSINKADYSAFSLFSSYSTNQ